MAAQPQLAHSRHSDSRLNIALMCRPLRPASLDFDPHYSTVVAFNAVDVGRARHHEDDDGPGKQLRGRRP
jgi:hypothetical protein